jgi:hypothetical protein
MGQSNWVIAKKKEKKGKKRSKVGFVRHPGKLVYEGCARTDRHLKYYIGGPKRRTSILQNKTFYFWKLP